MGKLLAINKADAEVIRQAGLECSGVLISKWTVEHIRNGEVIDTETTTNLCTYQGVNRLLNVMFNSATQITNWYVAVFESNSTPATSATYASPGYTECTAYTETTRPAYQSASASNGVITNSANKAEFTFNASKTIYGASIVNVSTKGDTSNSNGVLYGIDRFSSSKSVVSSDILRITVEIGFTLS